MNRFFMSLVLVLLVSGSTLENSWAQETPKKPLESQPEGKNLKPDAAATKLMSDTHDHWAHWTDFPGVSADVEVNLNGIISKGRVQVSRKGKVELQLPVAAAQSFAKEILNSIVGHRLDRRLDVGEPCAFVDEVSTHPLGRAVRVLKDSPGTSYRIRDKEVIQVNRTMGGVRYTHTILANRHNIDKKHLTVAYVADLWDVKTGALVRTDTNHQTWIRVGKFDLPEVITRIRASADHELEVGTLKLSALKLGPK